jgi:hypothetical protein
LFSAAKGKRHAPERKNPGYSRVALRSIEWRGFCLSWPKMRMAWILPFRAENNGAARRAAAAAKAHSHNNKKSHD